MTIEVRSAVKRRGTRLLWNGLSFDVGAGEFVTVLGPSGSGKSTLLDCIGHLDRFDAGTLRVGGVAAGRSNRRARAVRRRSLGYLFQDFGLVPELTAAENIAIAVPRRLRDGRAAARALGTVGLTGVASRRAFELSGGEQQRVALARLFVKRPAVILADEPTSALDAANEGLVLDTLRDLAGKGAAVLVATHSAGVQAVSDRSVVLSGAVD
ncbi:ABC transporter ATP-binding protein [Curtobacterium luteum]|uniref:ABC transporter domain-containing protein n=1 Tax=Curtobacterium luteum TaxID=33881 RepID=A0A175S173_9MICO|nr:ATP-binding cassette domain-containing protein [Curtobacterium luteum]KTR08883.1 hypothetical protein NS184_04765 [Curtobacterium luteum]